jgi:hypothetical protein
MQLSKTELFAFVDSLNIQPPSEQMRKTQVTLMGAAATDAPSANVDGGSLVAFTANVSDQHRSDALNSTLIAQLHANTLFDKNNNDQVISWYGAYLDVLTHLGWPAQKSQFQNYQASGSTFSIDTAITSIVTSFLTADEAAIVKAALDALNNLGSGDPWYKVWDSSTHSADGGGFQLGMCSDANGAINSLVLKLSSYAFHTTESTTRFLWADYSSSDTTLRYVSDTVVLNEDVYSQVRQQVIDKLGANAAAYIGNLSI